MNTANDIVHSPINGGAFLPTGDEQPPMEGPLVPTGITSLDNQLRGGVRVGTFNVICGYTGDGKSSFVVHLAQTAAALGHPVQLYHSEMTTEEYLQRLKSWESGVAYAKIRGVVPVDFPLIEVLSLRSGGNAGVQDIVANISPLKTAHKNKPVVIVDSMDGIESGRKQLEEIAQSLASMAGQEDALVWATSQANSRGTTVTIDNLREATGKAFPCSLLIGLGRSCPEDKGSDAVLTVDKNRYGSRFQIRTRVRWECQWFSDVDDSYLIPRVQGEPTICDPGDKSAHGESDKSAHGESDKSAHESDKSARESDKSENL
ncbi:MAG: hypothetical protein H7A51_04220 [Akkermansiaceae bacterium]|nr:hypothetical protein [Akkermansiaceae bacterium]